MEISIFSSYGLFINLEDIYLVNLSSQQIKTNVVYEQKFSGSQTYANCFSLFSNEMSCYIENQSVANQGQGNDHANVDVKQKYLVEFVAPTEKDIYKLPPIRLVIDDGAVLETVFSNFLVLRMPDKRVQLLSRENYQVVYEVVPALDLVSIEASDLAPMPVTSALDLGVIIMQDANADLILRMMNVRYPFYEINVGELTQDTSCIAYMDGCQIVNFKLTSPD